MLSLDASRLARNNRDWHQLLELCSTFGVVIGDGERLYDPGVYHNRLFLGLSGIMSEAELHQIRVRLHQGGRQKATRGELRLPLPAGLAHGAGDAVVLNLDEEVQARLRLVFSLFPGVAERQGGDGGRERLLAFAGSVLARRSRHSCLNCIRLQTASHRN